jgi:hypothetical protein
MHFYQVDENGVFCYQADVRGACKDICKESGPAMTAHGSLDPINKKCLS